MVIQSKTGNKSSKNASTIKAAPILAIIVIAPIRRVIVVGNTAPTISPAAFRVLDNCNDMIELKHEIQRNSILLYHHYSIFFSYVFLTLEI